MGRWGLLGAAVLCASACGHVAWPGSRSAEERVLRHQIGALRSLARSDASRDADDMVVGVERALIEDTLNAATPWSGEVAGRFVVEVRRASVSLEEGVALVRLRGRARSRTGDAGEAALTLHAGIDSAEVEPGSRTLRARVSLIAFEAGPPDGRGAPGSSSGSLEEELGELGLEAFAQVLSRVAIPVSIEERVRLPELGPRPVGVAAMDVPASLAVTGVWAFRDRLWVTLQGQARTGAETRP